MSVFSQGPQWREFRTKVNPALLKPKLVKVYAPALEEISKDMVARYIKSFLAACTKICQTFVLTKILLGGSRT